MSAVRRDVFAERLPDEIEIKNADQLRTIIASQANPDEGVSISLALNAEELKTITLSPALADSFMELLRLVSTGRGFRMIPVDAELTSQEAADFLNVSRPYLVKILENGEIPYVKTGRHRKVRASDIFAYKQKRDEIRSSALSELAAMDAELL